MAKKKTAKKTPRKKAAPKPADDPPALLDTSELAADAANPRRITDEAARGLGKSLERFGDLSGIVFNRRTGELVCGHQRMNAIRSTWGEQPIATLPGGEHVIRIDERRAFRVRVVDWSRAMQRAANTAANNQKIAGEFTDDLSAYLLEVEADLADEAPGVLDDVLLTELMADGLDTADATEGEDGGDQGVAGAYEVIVACRDEPHQREVYEQLKQAGHTVKGLTL